MQDLPQKSNRALEIEEEMATIIRITEMLDGDSEMSQLGLATFNELYPEKTVGRETTLWIVTSPSMASTILSGRAYNLGKEMAEIIRNEKGGTGLSSGT